MKIPGIACTELLLSLSKYAEVLPELAEVLPELVEGRYCDCLRQAQAAV
jgi:hypothetical protein